MCTKLEADLGKGGPSTRRCAGVAGRRDHGVQAHHLQRRQLHGGVGRGGRAAWAAEPSGHPGRAPAPSWPRRTPTSSRSTACCPTGNSSRASRSTSISTSRRSTSRARPGQYMAQTMVLPAAARYLADLLKSAERANEVGSEDRGDPGDGEAPQRPHRSAGREARRAGRRRTRSSAATTCCRRPSTCGRTSSPRLNDVRDVVDRLERVVPDDLWPFPTYRDMLFIK